MVVMILFWLCVLLFIYKQIKNAKEFSNKEDKLLIYFIQPILLIGILVRTIYLVYPFGVFCDEAINGYDSWSLAHYGVDQHLTSYPVYLESWGTGQSALYAYLALPFIKLFGLSTAIHRMPMAIISCISLLFLYWTLIKTQKNNLLVFIVTAFFIISPWHIMKSRWALDCNICPDLILIAVCFFILAYYTLKSRKQTIFYILGFIFLAISAYAYGISWFMLPLFTIILIVYFLKKKKITTKQLLLSCGIMTLALIPIVLFAFNLFFDGEEYKLGPLTIISMEGRRHEDTTLLGSESVFGYLSDHIRDSLKFLFSGSDGLPWNYIKPWGQFYNILGIPFILYYFIAGVTKRYFKVIDFIFIAWFIACLLILIFVSPNVNHWNLLWFPLMFFCASGLYMIISRFRKAAYVIAPLFLGCFIIFTLQYFDYYSPDNRKRLWYNSGFNYMLEEPVKFISQKNVDRVYFSGYHFSAWDRDASIVLFYNPVEPSKLTHKTIIREGTHTIVDHFNNNFFYLPALIVPEPKTAYVISEDELKGLNIDYSKFNKQDFDFYIVLWNE